MMYNTDCKEGKEPSSQDRPVVFGRSSRLNISVR
jgi:hypothetical protein